VGYGLYYGKLPGATIRAPLLDTAMPHSVTRPRILPGTETACPQSALGVGFGYPCSFLTPPPVWLQQPLRRSSSIAAFARL